VRVPNVLAPLGEDGQRPHHSTDHIGIKLRIVSDDTLGLILAEILEAVFFDAVMEAFAPAHIDERRLIDSMEVL
jgi:hypothetical protein